MHVCKFKRRNTRFVGHNMSVSACVSCHEVEKEYTVETENEIFVLPKGSVLPHIQKEHDRLAVLRQAVIKGKKMAKQGGLLVVLQAKLVEVSDGKLETMLAKNVRLI